MPETRTVTTDADAVVDTLAHAAALDPHTAEVVAADVRDGELALAVRGAPLGGESDG